MQKITPFLWFDNNAEEAVSFYASIFKDTKITGTNRVAGKVLTINFELDGRPYIALNGGPHYKFNEAFSLFVSCETQQEVDDLWAKLSAGGSGEQCGWLKDKFGLSWQVVPKILIQLLGDPDPAKSNAVLQAMLKMKKIVIADLRAAHQAAA